jgi:hypothetical protein
VEEEELKTHITRIHTYRIDDVFVQNEFNFLRVVERVIPVVVDVISASAQYCYSSIGGGRTERGPDFVPVVVHVSHHIFDDVSTTKRRFAKTRELDVFYLGFRV